MYLRRAILLPQQLYPTKLNQQMLVQGIIEKILKTTDRDINPLEKIDKRPEGGKWGT